MAHKVAPEGRKVLVVAPYGRDAAAVTQMLGEAGYEAAAFHDLSALAGALDEATGAVMLTDEALTSGLNDLARAMDRQPEWSDPHFVLLSSRQTGRLDSGQGARMALQGFATNLIVLERPLGRISLLSALDAALRARQKQFQLRDRLKDLADSRQDLAASEQELRRITDALPVLIAFVGRDLHYRFANAAYQDWFGLPSSQVIGHHVGEVVGQAALDERIDAMQRALAGEDVELRLPWPRPDGSRRDAEIRYLPRRGEDGAIDGFHVFVQDVTTRTQAEEVLRDTAEVLEARVADRTVALQEEVAARARAEAALRQSQKMEAVGQLTGGIAHDFNNMLTGVIGSLDLIKRRLATGRTDDIERFMDAASASALRAAALTQRLLAFSRRQSLDAKPVDVNALVESLEDLLQRTIGERIALRIVTSDTAPAASVDANQLESAILNLSINARDAMPDGGKLTIETSVVDIDEAYVADKPDFSPGRYVVVAVSDTGVGMEPSVLERVFEPFFTTKPMGQGTGLGLSMVYGFARQSDGQVRVHSAPGQGASVKIFLPAAKLSPESDTVAPTQTPAGDGQTVLVVEDDASVRLLIVEVLRELGYQAIEVPDAPDAVPILASNQTIDLMISDVGLPGMNGRQLAEIAREHRPDLPILFVTGYAENAAIRAGFLGSNMSMITKPFALEVLAAKISEMMSRTALSVVD